ncbi:MAG: gliding motility lipoprotein GldH [Flavobacteriaceae bacterium]
MNKSIVFLLAFCLTSCVEAPYWSAQHDFDKEAWMSNENVEFEFPVENADTRYDLLINLRNNNTYPFSNIFLITQMQGPNGIQLVDTLEFEMADKQGNWLGSGITDVKESLLVFKEDFEFDEIGVYDLTIKQAVRRLGEVKPVDPLEGVVGIGITIELKE